MKKTNRNLKRIKFAKHLLVLIFIQALILIIFVPSWIDGSLDEGELIESTITVEKVDYSYMLIGKRAVRIYSGEEEYFFVKIPVSGTDEYSQYELSKNIKVGDELFIKYIDKDVRSLIIEAKKGDNVLRSFSAYSKYEQRNQVLSIIFFAIIEALFLCALAFFVILYHRDIKLFTKNRCRKKKRSEP